MGSGGVGLILSGASAMTPGLLLRVIRMFCLAALSCVGSLLIYPLGITVEGRIKLHSYGFGYGLGWGAAFFYCAGMSHRASLGWGRGPSGWSSLLSGPGCMVSKSGLGLDAGGGVFLGGERKKHARFHGFGNFLAINKYQF